MTNWQKLNIDDHMYQLVTGLKQAGYGEELQPQPDTLPLEQDRDDLYILWEGGLLHSLESAFFGHGNSSPRLAHSIDFPDITVLHEIYEANLPEELQLELALISVNDTLYIIATQNALGSLNIETPNAPNFESFHESPLNLRLDNDGGMS